MPLKPNKYWMFWGLFFTVLGLILLNFMLMPVDFKARPVQAKMAHAEEITRIDLIDDEITVNSRPADVISFTQKAACRHNIQAINTMVELWYVQHDGNWPKKDLSDIGHDIDYFPRGVARCPLDGGHYTLDPVSHWVQGHDHGDIKNPFMDEPAFSQ